MAITVRVQGVTGISEKKIVQTAGRQQLGEFAPEFVTTMMMSYSGKTGTMSDTEYDLEHVKEELADVMVYCRNLLDELGLDEDEIINAKMDQNEAKHPVEKARGSAKKYYELKEKP